MQLRTCCPMCRAARVQAGEAQPWLRQLLEITAATADASEGVSPPMRESVHAMVRVVLQEGPQSSLELFDVHLDVYFGLNATQAPTP